MSSPVEPSSAAQVARGPDAPARLRVLYFAALRDTVGQSEEQLEIPCTVRKVGELGPFLEAHHPALRGRLASVRIAVNEAFAPDDAELGDGDTVALIPPVAGG